MRISDQEFNRVNVLRILRRLEPVSRTDLTRASQLTGGSITQITAALLARRLILEERVAPAGRGRPRVNLRLNPTGAYALSSYVSVEGRLVCEIVDLRGEPVDHFTAAIPKTSTIAELTAAIISTLQRALARSTLPQGAIQIIGIALPAVVDTTQGIVHWVQTITGTPYPMAEAIQAVVGIPVIIDNGINALARAEHWFGLAERADDFMIINLGYGISASHYRDGVLQVGTHGLNCEIGHSKLMLDSGLPCSCGATGCLDAYASLHGLVSQLSKACAEPMPRLTQLYAAIGRYVARAATVEGTALDQILRHAGTYLGVILSNLINSHDPGRILVLSDRWQMPEVFCNAVKEAVRRNCLPPFTDITSLEFRRYDQDMFHLGAAALVLEQLYRIR